MNTPFDQRANNFDCIRMFLAVLVIYSHSYVLATGSELREPLMLLTRGQVSGGHVAVDAFFIVSGFLITASFERSKSLFSYFKKRIFRIYPAFVIAMAISAVCVLPLSGGAFQKQSFLAILLDWIVQTAHLREFHYVHAFANNPYSGWVNGSIWTILYEFFCYIGLAVLGLCGILRSNRALAGLLALSIVVSFISAINGWLVGQHVARFAPMYLAGVVFYRFRHRIPLGNRWLLGAIALLAIAARLPHMLLLALPIAGSYLILAVAFHPALRAHGFGRFGDFSYGTYLYAFPIQQLVAQRLAPSVSPLTLFAVATPCTLVAAVCSWYGVERWFLRLAHESKKTAEATVSGAEATPVGGG
jgi:peptidoglycan/LPS O-acetylase OafA/YrhL